MFKNEKIYTDSICLLFGLKRFHCFASKTLQNDSKLVETSKTSSVSRCYAIYVKNKTFFQS